MESELEMIETNKIMLILILLSLKRCAKVFVVIYFLSKLKTVYRYKNYQNETCCRYPDYTERSEPDPELVLEDGDYTFIKVGTAIIPS